MIIVTPEDAANLDVIEAFLQESFDFVHRYDGREDVIYCKLSALTFIVRLTPAGKFLATSKTVKCAAPWDGTPVHVDERYIGTVNEVREFFGESLAQYSEPSSHVLAA